MEQERLVDATNQQHEEEGLSSLRPLTFKDYIGQSKIKEELSIYITAAKARNEALDHVLLYGPPGLGKTTLAMIIANEMGVSIQTTSGPAIERPGDLLAILNELTPGDILFIDEIHRLPKVVEEVLYSAMEDYFVDIIIGQGPTAHPVHFQLPPFTMIGATTRAGALSKPLRDRFGILGHMQYYETKDLQAIVERSAHVLATEIVPEGALEIALRSRGTPRIANRILKRVRDFAQVKSDGRVTQDLAQTALDALEIDQFGLDQIDRKLLTMMIEFYQGGPVGINTIALNIGEDSETVEDMYEPYLIQHGFLQRTPRGRRVTQLAYQHLGFPYPEDNKEEF